MDDAEEDLAGLVVLLLKVCLDLAVERFFPALKVGTQCAAGLGNRQAVIVLVQDFQW